MAAPEGVAHSSAFRTTWPPTRCVSQPLPPGHRKFPFETQAADPGSIAAVAVEHLLNQSDEDCGQELLATGFGSPGTGSWADVEGGRDRLGMEELTIPTHPWSRGRSGRALLDSSLAGEAGGMWRGEVGEDWPTMG